MSILVPTQVQGRAQLAVSLDEPPSGQREGVLRRPLTHLGGQELLFGVEDVGAYYPHRVTYHPTCHSLRMLRVGDRPLQLLHAVRGLHLVELPDVGHGFKAPLGSGRNVSAELAQPIHQFINTHLGGN